MPGGSVVDDFVDEMWLPLPLSLTLRVQSLAETGPVRFVVGHGPKAVAGDEGADEVWFCDDVSRHEIWRGKGPGGVLITGPAEYVEVAEEEAMVDALSGSVSDGVEGSTYDLKRFATMLSTKASLSRPWFRRSSRVGFSLVVWIRRAGASRTRDETRAGKCDAKLSAIPPPREWPMRANRWLPVQGMGDEVIASKMHVVKNRVDCGVLGAEE